MKKFKYIVLGYNGIDYFTKWFDKTLFPDTELYLVDNGNQLIPDSMKEHVIHQTQTNIGCSGGWNLVCDIAFKHYGFEKVIIGQEDARVSEEVFEALLDECNPTTICGTYNNSFEFSTYAIHRDTFEKIGRFDENFLFAGCEDNDYKHRASLVGVDIKTLGVSHMYNISIANNSNVVPARSCKHNANYVMNKWNNYQYTIPWNGIDTPKYTDYFIEVFGETKEWPSENEYNLFTENQL